MKVVKVSKDVLLNDIEQGDIFYVNEEYFMKTDRVLKIDPELLYCVNLVTGVIVYLSHRMEVRKVKMKCEVELI